MFELKHARILQTQEILVFAMHSLHHQRMECVLSTSQQALPMDVPVGAAIYVGDECISTAYNQRERDNDPTGHAELIVLRKAGKKLGNWRLNNAIIYVTLEPCPMCAWALYQARIGTIVYGAADPLWGACGSRFNAFANKPDTEIIKGILENECQVSLNQFFQTKRP